MAGGMLHQGREGGNSVRPTITVAGEVNVVAVLQKSSVPVLVVPEWSAAGSTAAERGGILSGGGCDPAGSGESWAGRGRRRNRN